MLALGTPFFLLTTAAAQTDPLIEEMVQAVSRDRLTSYVQTLQDFQTRHTYTQGNTDAGNWLYDFFADLGLEVELHQFTYSSHTEQNIIARIPGRALPDEIVAISGHFDSTSNDPYNLAPGADDDASGIAAVLEAALIFKDYQFQRTIEFWCYNAEEQGRQGSQAIANDYVAAGRNIVAVVNNDMIGYWPTGWERDLDVAYEPVSEGLADHIISICQSYVGIPIAKHPSASCQDDHVSFTALGIPAVTNMDCWEAHNGGGESTPHYHRTTDTISTLNLDCMTEAVQVNIASVADMAGIDNGANGLPYLIAGPGLSYDNPPTVREFPPEQDATQVNEFTAYGSPHYGVLVSCGDLDGDGMDEILTGPGPGRIYGPHVRGFEGDGTPLAGLSFMAYGTLRYGVNVCAGDIDGDGFAEIVTGAGPGAVFGPHVRAFDYDGTPGVAAVPDVSYFAYGTPKWGVNVAGGDIDGDDFDEIVTGAGPGAVYGPHVRGWNVDGGSATAIPAVSFMAYGTDKFGVVVTCGDVDGDGIDEIITGAGPGQGFGAHIRGWNYDGAALMPISGINFFAWPPAAVRYGAKVFAGADLNGDGKDELVVGCGPDPNAGTPIKVFLYDGTQVTLWFSLDAFDGLTHGTNVATGRF